MMIFKKAIPRRAFLRGFGATVALPFLDGMIPSFAKPMETPTSPTRLAFIYVPNGAIMESWTPTSEGAEFEFAPILEPLAPFRDQLLVLSGLDSNQGLGIEGETGGEHPRASAAYLTGVHTVQSSVRTEREEIRAGVSVDQVAARAMEKVTQLGSLELAIEPSGLVCDGGCAYTNTVCWRNATTPLPMENQPRAVFERLFGSSDSTDPAERQARMKRNRSILDFMSSETARLMGDLTASDRIQVNQYLDAVRDVERRIQLAETQSNQDLPTVERPVGIPPTFSEHIKLMFDLKVVAFQTDMTRVGTLQVGHEMSTQAYPEISINDPHHPFTHHQGDPAKIEKARQVNIFHMQMFQHFLERMRSTPDGEGSLLDHSMIVYGSGLGDGNLHIPKDLPILLAGGGSGKIKGGRHIRYKEVPLCNLFVSLLEKLDVHVEKFGDSNGKLYI